MKGDPSTPRPQRFPQPTRMLSAGRSHRMLAKAYCFKINPLRRYPPPATHRCGRCVCAGQPSQGETAVGGHIYQNEPCDAPRWPVVRLRNGAHCVCGTGVLLVGSGQRRVAGAARICSKHCGHRTMGPGRMFNLWMVAFGLLFFPSDFLHYAANKCWNGRKISSMGFRKWFLKYRSRNLASSFL